MPSVICEVVIATQNLAQAYEGNFAAAGRHVPEKSCHQFIWPIRAFRERGHDFLKQNFQSSFLCNGSSVGVLISKLHF